MARRKERARAWVRPDYRNKRRPRSKWRWIVQYEDPSDGFRTRTKGGFLSPTAAEDWRDEFTQQTRQGRWVDPAAGDQTFSAVAEHWLENVYVPRGEKSRGYLQHAQIIKGTRSLTRCEFGGTRIGDITPSMVGGWLNSMQKAGKSPSTRRHNFYTFRKVMRHAFAEGLIATDPTVGFKGPEQDSVAAQQQTLDAIPTASLPLLIAAMPEPWDMYVRLAADSWMRPEELCGLQLGDVAADASLLHVRRVLVKGRDGTLTYERRPKTDAANRVVDLSPSAARTLSQYIRAHHERATRWFTDHPEREHPGDRLPLFVGVDDFRRGAKQRQQGTDLDWLDYAKPLTHGWVTSRHWVRAREAANLPDTVRFYDLRHHGISYAVSKLGEEGALTLTEISRRAGHANTAMTLNRYSHPLPDRDDARRSALDSMWDAADEVTPIRRGA